MTIDPLVSVGLVLLLLLVALSWLARRVPGGSLAGTKERVCLTPQHTVHVIEVGGLRLLVGTGPGGAPQLLARLGEAETRASAPEPAPELPRAMGLLLGLNRMAARS